ncbi:hypothetical protein T01_6369 [Trichinella spiralis]|uniref:Uncharacterized protein n=1 Tax=Trichinella spiralis TaxID=6334 RepID=A0A0V1BH79_TRISP|nr:hypothetical protein T01_6369 [Trichinella spiralis]
MIVERVELRKMSTDTCIKRLCVRNFMCHKDIGMALLGERINFIIGVNGITKLIRSQLFQNYCGLDVDFHVKAIQLLVVVVL